MKRSSDIRELYIINEKGTMCLGLSLIINTWILSIAEAEYNNFYMLLLFPKIVILGQN